MLCRLNVLIFAATAFLPGTAPAHAAESFANFVTAHDAQLFDGPRRLRFISWNIPNLLTIEDSFEFLGESPWRWPDEFELNDALASVRQIGGEVARTYVITVRREGADMGDHVHVLGPDEFNEEAFVALDRALAAASKQHVRLIIPLVDNWHWMGGIEQYAAFRGKQASEFWTDRQIIDDFKATIRHIVTRRNTVTGTRYCDDKAIFGWETGNEIDATAEWTAEIAAYLKELDPNHVVIDGRSLHGIPEWSLADKNVDVVTTHHYPKPGIDLVAAITTAARTARGKKAYFVGEAGFVPIDEAKRAFAAAIDEDTSGALYWSLRFHRREGGFYWHDEPMGANLFKAYHWPGFDSGDSYEEKPLLAAMTAASVRIRGGEPPPKPVAVAPKLLPIDHPAHLSWQGVAGASGYDIQRASAADGPWAVIADNVSDADVQYRPLACDGSAERGRNYWYRVVARGAWGASKPSNIVGPVAPQHRVLVDECRSDESPARRDGNIEFHFDRARRTQEDVHRLALSPGASLTYNAPEPIAEVETWLFTESADAPCVVEFSTDGTTYRAGRLERTTPRRGAGDYGYLQPVLVAAVPADDGARFVRIRNPQEASAVWEASRVEISYGGPNPPPPPTTGHKP